jgi:site-specific DNA-methyltransferase (adenine-specific)
MSLPKPYYLDDYATIYLGDCRKILPLLDPVDLVLTDPPYGIDFQSPRPIESRKKEKIKGDGLQEYLNTLNWFLPLTKQILADGGCCCCCCCGGCGTPSLAYLWIEAGKHLNVENVCVWDKGFVGLGWRYRFQWEAVLIATKGERKIWNGGENKSNILRFQKIIPQNGDHPTPKPTTLMGSLIEDNSNQNSTILDPFMGSGTTLRAAKDLGRKSIGIEIEEKYCEIAVKRLAQEVFNFGKNA